MLQQEADNDQRRVEKELAFDSHHPTVQAAQKLKSTIDRQINERLEGILGGLNAQLLADKARFEMSEREKFEAMNRDPRPWWNSPFRL